jgi:Tfp pilus assembly protein PilX
MRHGMGALLSACAVTDARYLWVPKTIATWADSRETPPLGACARCRRAGPHLAVRAMIFGLWA